MDEGYDAPERHRRRRSELVEEVLSAPASTAPSCSASASGLPGPDPPRHRPGRLGGDPARLGGPAVAREMERPPRRCPCTSTTTPTSARWPSSTGAPASGADDLVYLKVATGIGAGLVSTGALFYGAGGTAGEIGHMTIDEHGPLCRCGNRGCLETFAGGARDRRAAALAASATS